MAPLWKERGLLLLKGMAMGAADSVPGVSGGTIALICGIYERLIKTIKDIPGHLPLLRYQGLAAYWRAIDGNFLLILLLGILGALYMSANSVLYLLENHFLLVMAFFIGLILASTWMIQKQVRRWNLSSILFSLLGGGITLLSAFANPLQGNYDLLYLFFCGMIAICAMILPGLSGAFILILLGVYDYVLDALRSLEFLIIIVFASGCAIGLLSFSHLLTWTFANFRQQTYAFLTGMLTASIAVLWPWKFQAEHGVISENLLPTEYQALTGESPEYLLVLLLIAVGFTLITLIEHLAGAPEAKVSQDRP